MHIFLPIYAVLLTLAYVHFTLEFFQQKRGIQWTDDRDEEFARLWEAAWKLTMIPKDNPLENFKQHGMLAKDAFMRADVLIPALDERLGVLDIGLNAVSREAKALKTWEQTHAPPVKHYWQNRRTHKPPAPTMEQAASKFVDITKQLGS